jgi:hypothetical protein
MQQMEESQDVPVRGRVPPKLVTRRAKELFPKVRANETAGHFDGQSDCFLTGNAECRPIITNLARDRVLGSAHSGGA